MGKKSREKRERKMAITTEGPELFLQKLHAFHAKATRKNEFEKEFKARVEATQTLLRQYRPLDAALAISVSDLWPANVGSPVKHIFAWCVLLGLEHIDVAAMSIASHAEFTAFAEGLYAVWPQFPMLEDFTPEPDWGQTRVRLGEDFVSMFYGSCIERTPDFVEAFRITYAHVPEALAHMDLAVSIQTRIIDANPCMRSIPISESQQGHVEVPSEDFWNACRAALIQIGTDIADWRNAAGHALETTLDGYKAPLARDAFGDAVMQGKALPFLAVAAGSEWIPISVRSGPGVVIDHWASRHVAGISVDTHRTLARFVVERFRGAVLGPLTLVIGDAPFEDLLVSCVISAKSRVYLICACDHACLERHSRAAKRAYVKLRQGARLHFRFINGRPLMLSKDGVTGPTADELCILLVLTQGSTAMGSIAVPERPVRLMPLADFVTIVDSLEDFSELELFWKYVDEQRGALSPFSTGAADLFASFKDTHGVLVEGAVSPTFISLDPHWGTTWRFEKLSTFWSIAPRFFPDGSSGWRLDEGTEGVTILNSRHHRSLAYSTTVGHCTAQAVVYMNREMEIDDGRMVDLFAQILADSMYRCQALISDAPLFAGPHVVFSCELDLASSVGTENPPEQLENFPNVVIAASREIEGKNRLRLKLSARAIHAGLIDASDGTFEIRCLVEALATSHAACGMALPPRLAARLGGMASELPRYHLKVVGRHVDVPDYVEPILPSLTDYKLARKHLAIAMKEIGLIPGRYELSEAKARIDPASERLRFHIASRVASLNRQQFLQACIEEHDALLIAGRLKFQRARQSLSHAVEYDRIDAVDGARKELGLSARHYRYLLEKVVSSPVGGAEPVNNEVLRELVGLVDWYMVLTSASDVLHNGVHVGGVEIDDSFIPAVFYSTGSDQREDQFAREDAKSRLGIDVNSQDVVEGASAELLSSQKMREAFLVDVGFELLNLIDALAVLSQAQRRGFGDELALSYTAEVGEIADVLAETIDGLMVAEARKIVDFLTLSEAGICRLPGRAVDEIDVPYWEHSKRIHRYAIRPLVRDGERLRWGAEHVSRAMTIWMSSVRDGYLPADFDWPNVVPVIRQVKEGIEKELEVRTEQVFRRHTPYVVRGFDFFKKFKGERFEDVGDFDVLAFWPDTNTLVTVECKYNQPPFTVKDGRRLRDRIFGKAEDDKAGQFSRILRRRKFVFENRQRMLDLLEWPTPGDRVQQDVELYVSRSTYYWMVNPPYPVPTKFVRVDALDSWIKNELVEPPAESEKISEIHDESQ